MCVGAKVPLQNQRILLTSLLSDLGEVGGLDLNVDTWGQIGRDT